ncbi:hypothetical protein GF373_17120 [bacterium]|nr:hypothetical protein [bacterium]
MHTTSSNQSQQALPIQTALIWIDPAFKDVTARIVRGFALAEACRDHAIPTVLLSCPETDGSFLDSNLYRIHLLDNTRKKSTQDFAALLDRWEPDLVIADLVNPSKPQSLKARIPHLALIGDSFSESLFYADTVLLPGPVPYPNFETLDLLPSTLDNSLHGQRYIPLPHQYFTEREHTPSKIGLALSGNCSVHDVDVLVTLITHLGWMDYFFFADMPEKAFWPIRNAYPNKGRNGFDLTIKQRIRFIDEARVILAYPDIHIFEFLARGKPVVLLPRNQIEYKICQEFAKKEVTLTLPLQTQEEREALPNQLQISIQNENTMQALARKAQDYMKAECANNAVEEILKRC